MLVRCSGTDSAALPTFWHHSSLCWHHIIALRASSRRMPSLACSLASAAAPAHEHSSIPLQHAPGEPDTGRGRQTFDPATLETLAHARLSALLQRAQPPGAQRTCQRLSGRLCKGVASGQVQVWGAGVQQAQAGCVQAVHCLQVAHARPRPPRALQRRQAAGKCPQTQHLRRTRCQATRAMRSALGSVQARQ